MRRIDRRTLLRLTASSAATWATACGPAAVAGAKPLLLPPDPPPEPEPEPVLDVAEPGTALGQEEILDWDPRAIPLDDAAFPLGVQAGAPVDDGAILWGNAPGLQRALVRVWRDAPGGVVLDDQQVIEPGPGGSFRLPISGLQAGGEYHYAVFTEDLGARSAVGRVVTAFPPEELRPLTLGCMTCTNQGKVSRFTSLETLAQHDFDLLVHLGDMSYNDGARTLEEYRAKWHDTLNDEGYRAVLPKAGMVMAWDDHEIDNNLDPTSFPADALAAAKDAFFESLPMWRGPNGQIWRRFRWGRTAEIIILDTRTERIPRGDDKRYISYEQMEFLKDALLNSPCHFKIVLNSVPITEMPTLWLNQGDRWQGYGDQRDELTAFIEDNNLDNIWFLSGDFHSGFVSRVQKEGHLSRLWEVAVGPSGNFGNPLAMGADAGIAVEQVFPSDQFLYGSGRIATTLLTFDPANDNVRIQFLDPEDGTPRFDQLVSRDD
jgi:alkaline phosphatase D